jgi:hypothetical protein
MSKNNSKQATKRTDENERGAKANSDSSSAKVSESSVQWDQEFKD